MKGGIPNAAFHELKIPLNTVAKEIHKIAVVSPNGEMVTALSSPFSLQLSSFR